MNYIRIALYITYDLFGRLEKLEGEVQMNELQDKLGSGLNKIQDSLQTNKQKLQNAQTINQYKRSMQEASIKRNEILLQLGEEVYKKLRKNEISSSDELTKKMTSIMELDRTIYKSQQSISELNTKSDAQFACNSCGSPVTSEDKFCGGCGARVELPKSDVNVETSACPACEEQIPLNASFCNCCGLKTS